MVRSPLSKEEVIAAIERKGSGVKIPLVFHKWWGAGLEDKYGGALRDMAAHYPDDIFTAWYNCPGDTRSTTKTPSYRWGFKEDYSRAERHGIGDTSVLLDSWDDLDAFLADFPNPEEPGTFDEVERALPQAGDRYKLGCWWCLFHERFWGIRGMENLMLDYFDNMEGLQILGRRLLEYHKRIVDRYAALGFDGIFTSDDLGHQRGPMMSPTVFEELYLPLYKDFCGYAHSKGMHVFLHSCGDNTLLLPMLIEAGLDVFHPVQLGCMDGAATVERFGRRISFLAGADVQHLLPEGSRREVRDGIRSMMDVFYKPKGGLLLAAGNGIMPDTPLENIDEMLLQMATYRPA